MSSNSDVSIKNATAGGDVVGRDKIIYQIIQPVYDGKIELLIKKHEEEYLKNGEYKEISDRLNRFLQVKKSENNKIRDLEQKLKDGDREYLIENAIELKELIIKKIHKFIMYKTAQDLFVAILTRINLDFIHQIYSSIQSGDFKVHEIEKMVDKEIIDPIAQMLSESALDIDKSEVYGMLYLLAGNCFIDWDKK